MRNRWWAAPGAAAAIVFLAACGSSAAGGSGNASPSSGGAASSSPSSAAGGSGSASASGIMTTSAKGGTVLTTANGATIYWFAIDTPKKSNCNDATCVKFWPPVTGKPTLGSGVNVPGKWGTIKRADGSTQATYNGHPLYTFAGDKSAGQDTGNGLNVNGGLWWAMTPSGAKLAVAPGGGGSPSPSGGGGGGYGY